MRRSVWFPMLSFAMAVLVTGFGSVTEASVEEDTWSFSIYAGNYDPGPDVIDDDVSFGVRLGKVLSPHFGWEGEIGYFNVEEDFTTPVPGSIDSDIIFFDFSLIRYLRVDSRVTPTLFGGAGFSSASSDVSVGGITFNDLDSESFTLHGGFGAIIDLGEKYYIRPSTRFRWFENRDDDEIDTEFTVAFGWKFGG